MTTTIKFGNDMSRILRGIAVILMVMNHSLPGKIIGFAVPLFSFLVGYGYAFAKKQDIANSFHRIWHLLSDYWVILFLFSLPAAWLTYPKPIPPTEILLAMFGLTGRLNFFAWYVYFYIFAMIVMPVIARFINRNGFVAAVTIALLFAAALVGVRYIPNFNQYLILRVAERCSMYMPIVVVGYYLARYDIFAKIKYPDNSLMILPALGVMIGIYFLRALPYVKIFDCLLAPLFAISMSVIFHVAGLKRIKYILTEMGLKSMNIWFLHGLFFTHATKAVYAPLLAWCHVKPIFVILLLIFSYLGAIVVEYVMKGLRMSANKLSNMANVCFRVNKS